MTFHFFTDEDAITKSQVIEEAYGPLPDQGDSMDRFNLQNSFEVKASASAFAITRSLVIAMESEGESSSGLLNLVLFPIENNFMAGFPVKFFIYRGISKASLLDAEGVIKIADSNWKESNILSLIKAAQDKTNKDRDPEDLLIAGSNSLGLHFNSLPNDTPLESLFLDATDNFHPIPVPIGCEIGKFKGGNSPASIQVVLEKIGQEGTIGLLKKMAHILEIPKLEIPDTLPEKGSLKMKFKDRLIREEVLAYQDITSFYGSCINQGFGVEGVGNSVEYLNEFKNKNRIYLDIRDERGFSFNHFFRLFDGVQTGFKIDDQINFEPLKLPEPMAYLLRGQQGLSI